MTLNTQFKNIKKQGITLIEFLAISSFAAFVVIIVSILQINFLQSLKEVDAADNLSTQTQSVDGCLENKYIDKSDDKKLYYDNKM